MATRPKFLTSFLSALKDEVEDEGIKALVPYYFIAFAMVSFFVAWNLPKVFWTDANWGVSISLYGGLLTFNGLVLTLGWSAFSRVHDILISKKLGSYIATKNLLNDYLLQISFMHLSQVLASIFSVAGIVLVLLRITPMWFDPTVFALCLTFTAHGLKQALDSVEMMNDLVWQAMEYDNGVEDGSKSGLQAINGGKK